MPKYIIEHITSTRKLYVANEWENRKPIKESGWRTEHIGCSAIFDSYEEALKRRNKYKHGTFQIVEVTKEIEDKLIEATNEQEK